MAFKKEGCPVRGEEKTRRKPGLSAWGESRADGGGKRKPVLGWEKELKLMEYDV